ncbi:MAG: hypothetical protein KDK41_17730 [Leptospiraceae bacterium]|nr:hypothetical protein [Leptospiraceae bacterium]
MNLPAEYQSHDLSLWQNTASEKAIDAWHKLKAELSKIPTEMHSFPYLLLQTQNADLKHSTRDTLYIMASSQYLARHFNRYLPKIQEILVLISPKGKIQFVHAGNAHEFGLKKNAT